MSKVTIKITFGGLFLLARKWPAGSNCNGANGRQRCLTTILGAPGHAGGHHGHGAHAHGVPQHVPYLAVPTLAIEAAGTPPALVTMFGTTQMALWEISGKTLTLAEADPDQGVRYRDALRKPDYSSSVQRAWGDWADFAWMADLGRALQRDVTLDPAAESHANCVIHLTDGDITGQPPRDRAMQRASFRWNAGGNGAFEQPFAEYVEYEVTCDTGDSGQVAVMLADPKDAKKSFAVLLNDTASLVVSNLPVDLNRGGSQTVIDHFDAYYDFVQLQPGEARPLPEFVPDTRAAGNSVGSSFIDPLFCLMAAVNVYA